MQKIIEEQQRLSETLKPTGSSQEPSNETPESNANHLQIFNGTHGQGQVIESCSPPHTSLSSGLLLSTTNGAFEAYPQSRRVGKIVAESLEGDLGLARSDGGIDHHTPSKKMRLNIDGGTDTLQRDDKTGLRKVGPETNLKPSEDRGP